MTPDPKELMPDEIWLWDGSNKHLMASTFKASEEHIKYTRASQPREVEDKDVLATICKASNLQSPKLKYETDYWLFALRAIREAGFKIKAGGVE